MAMGGEATASTGRWLERLAAGSPTVRLNARSVAAMVTTTHCSARRALDAARIDKRDLARRLGRPAPSGQSPFAIARGNRFEDRVKRDEFLELFGLLREFGLDTSTVEALDLPDLVEFDRTAPDTSLARRAEATRTALRQIASGTAPPGLVIDKATLVWRIGGVEVRLETDAVAWWVGGLLRIIEIKSFPVEWGQLEAEKVSAMAWQTAVYVAAVQDTLAEMGFDPSIVSTEIFLVCPVNTGLTPKVFPHDVSPQLRLLRRYEAREQGIEAIAATAGNITFHPGHCPDTDLPDMLDRLGPAFQPSCLSTCELSLHCRARAQERGDARALGADVVALTTGVSDLHRAVAIADTGRAQGAEEQAFADVVNRLRSVESAMPRSTT